MLTKPASLLEQWEAQGLIEHATRRSFDGIPQDSSPRTAKERLDEIRGDR